MVTSHKVLIIVHVLIIVRKNKLDKLEWCRESSFDGQAPMEIKNGMNQYGTNQYSPLGALFSGI
jgi:hypothetical protein